MQCAWICRRSARTVSETHDAASALATKVPCRPPATLQQRKFLIECELCNLLILSTGLFFELRWGDGTINTWNRYGTRP
jgi:hypothetical protein